MPQELSASEWLRQGIVGLANDIAEAQFVLHPELTRRFGERGKQKCISDNTFHLHYLAEAMACESIKIFVDYVGWAKIMLASRGIDYHDLQDNLAAMERVLTGKARRPHKQLFKSYLEEAKAALPTLPETVPALIDPQQPFSDVANAYLRSLLTLDRRGAIEHLLQHFEGGMSIRELFDHVITPVQREVGRLWQQNQITVVQEHFCTAATEMLLAGLRRKHLGVPREVSALTICAEGEEHCLGLKMFSDLLEADGWQVYYAGSKPPNAEVLKHLKSNKTDLVALSAATALNLGSMRALIAGIKSLPRDRTPRVLVGGMALAGDQKLWKKIGADAFAASVGEGLEQANLLIRR